MQFCRGIAAAHGLEVNADCDTLFPVTINDDAEAAFVSQLAQALFGAGRSVTLPVPLTGSEDFSQVLTAVPGAMAFLGACPPGPTQPRHRLTIRHRQFSTRQSLPTVSRCTLRTPYDGWLLSPPAPNPVDPSSYPPK